MDRPLTHISIQTDDFSHDQVVQAMRDSGCGIGAICCFTGLMRDVNEGDEVQAMTLEHYPGMTERSVGRIVDEARRRWPLRSVTVIHRVGTLRPADQIVLVAVASTHRAASFSACEFIMDFLKTRAPFWKKEYLSDGERWVEARQSDSDAASRWQK
jgi:molybdopterin synthase catalytic subunit